jgi:hypothetical protein
MAPRSRIEQTTAKRHHSSWQNVSMERIPHRPNMLRSDGLGKLTIQIYRWSHNTRTYGSSCRWRSMRQLAPALSSRSFRSLSATRCWRTFSRPAGLALNDRLLANPFGSFVTMASICRGSSGKPKLTRRCCLPLLATVSFQHNKRHPSTPGGRIVY